MSTIPPAMPYGQKPKRPFLARGWVWFVLLLIGGVGFWQFNSGTSVPKQTGPSIITITTATASKQTVPVTIEAVGNVVAYESVAVRARVDSQVTAVHFKDGDEVKKGDVLFELDGSALRARVTELQANIARDKAQVENARQQSSRAEALAEKGFATKANKDDSNAALAVAQASLGASAAALESARVQLAYTRITAPISGRTGTINVTLGNNVKANDTTPLVTINQLKPIRVQAALPQHYFDVLRNAMQTGPVTVSATLKDNIAGQPPAEGTLDYIDNSIDATTGTFVTRAGFPNADERLLPGMFVTVRLTLGVADAVLAIPEVAVQRGQNGDFVFVIADGKASQRAVTIRRLQHGLAVIATGLNEGDIVATDGMLGLKDGSAVQVAMPKSPTAPTMPLKEKK